VGCVRLDILDKQYYKPTALREAFKKHERSEYDIAENRRTGATLFSAKTFFCFVFFSHKKNEEETGYDAWGRRYRFEGTGMWPPNYFYFDDRVPFTVYPSPEEILDFFTRGFTGHEHLDMFGLINMNGRMYDPMLGRMLSPDPFVQAPTFSQSYNRYSYVWNNPLRFTDPTGYMTSGFGGGGDWGSYGPNGVGSPSNPWPISGPTITPNGGIDYVSLGQFMKGLAHNEFWNSMFQAWWNGGRVIPELPPGAGTYRPMNEMDLVGSTFYNGPGNRRGNETFGSARHQQTMSNPIVQAIHQGQISFLTNPVTLATVGTMAFVGLGGIQLSLSLARGSQSVIQMIGQSSRIDWIRFGPTVVPNQLIPGAGTTGVTRVPWAIRGGGYLGGKGGEYMGFHYHIHQYNWYRPWWWFRYTPPL
jgi:RHS repeat-associated protein